MGGPSPLWRCRNHARCKARASWHDGPMLRGALLLVVLWSAGCDCGTSHSRADGGFARDSAGEPDTRPPDVDAFVPPGCEAPGGEPRLISPLSTARVSSWRPQLWFEPASGGGETAVEICF